MNRAAIESDGTRGTRGTTGTTSSAIEKIRSQFNFEIENKKTKAEPEIKKTEPEQQPELMPSSWQLMIFHEQPICKNCFSKILIETASYMGINWRCWTCKSVIDYGSEPFEYTPPKRGAADK